MVKKYPFRVSLVLLILGILASFIISGRAACVGGKKRTRVGSSTGNTFIINAPSNLTATAGSTSQIELSWVNNATNADGFEIERSLDGITYTRLTTISTNTVSYSDTGLSSGTTYYYRVRAFMTTGDYSGYSNEVSAITSSIPPPELPSVWLQVAAGGNHTIALTTNGTVWSCGLNSYGQLGLGDTNFYSNYRTTPSLIESDFGWVAFENIATVSAGSWHSIALKTDGTLWSWGANGVGQLGVGWTDGTSANAPVQIGVYDSDGVLLITADSDWSAVATAQSSTIGLKTNKTLWAWGLNNYGQLGDGTQTDRYTPRQIGTDSDWTRVATSWSHALGIKTSGALWAWGFNYNSTPSLIVTDLDWSMIAAGSSGTTSNYSLGIKTNGTLWAWGDNASGQLGLGDYVYRYTPTAVGTDSDWSTIAAGFEHNFGLKTNGTLWAWGDNYYVQLGVGDTIQRNTPTQVGTASDWSTISAGDTHTIGLKTNKTLWAWGFNNYGQLGLGDSINRSIPCQLGSPIPPSGIALIVISSTQITISWTDRSNNESGFEIERATSAEGGPASGWTLLATVGSGITSYSDETVSPPNIYYYRISSYNTFGNSSYSNEVTPLATPSPLTLSVISSTEINLFWSNNSPDETGFTVERKIGVGDTYAQLANPTADTTFYPDATVTPGNTYYYRVKAYNTFISSPYSNEANATIRPDAPMALTATAISSSQIDLTWTDVYGETSYKVERSLTTATGYSLLATVGTDVTLYSDTVVTPATTCYYRVRGWNTGGYSDYSPEASATTPAGIPGAPTLVSADVISTTQINLSWTNIGGETDYKIERSLVTTSTYIQIATVNANVISYADTTVTPSNTYYYRLRAHNLSGNGPYSNEKFVTSTPLPFRPLSGDTPPIQYFELFPTTAGYRFSSNVNGQITALGRYAAGGGNTTVILWDDSGVELARVTVSSAIAWQWANLPTPINISAGTFYRVSVSCTTRWNDYFSMPTTRENITISGSYYNFGLDVFPNTFSAFGQMMGWADIEFVVE
jgi:alpha-tubulin suppressor-like RCC1 family protein